MNTKGMPSSTDVVSAYARALEQRIRWEMSNGVIGYPRRLAPAQRPADADSPAELAALRRAIGDCRRCPLHRGRTSLVFGEGDARAELVFVGEGPGRDEDLSGRPFVGAAGQLLTKIIQALGLEREQVYICNVVKCRPPENRVPTAEECATCGPFLLKQIEIIRPQVVVALGSTAARFLLAADKPLSAQRGRFQPTHGTRVMPTYHPAYLLRNASAKRLVWHDMLQVREALESIGLEARRKP